MTTEEILAEHPDLEAADIAEGLRFAALALQGRELPSAGRHDSESSPESPRDDIVEVTVVEGAIRRRHRHLQPHSYPQDRRRRQSQDPDRTDLTQASSRHESHGAVRSRLVGAL